MLNSAVLRRDGAVSLWALLASGKIQVRKLDGWETLSRPVEPMHLDIAA